MKQFFESIKKILNISGKVFLVVAVLVFVVNLFIIFSPGNREKTNFSKVTEQNRAEIYKNINDQKLNSSDQGKQAIAWYRIVNCFFIGEACTNNPNDGTTNSNKSVFGYITNGITMPYFNQPASGFYWVYDTLQNNNFVSKSYAAEGIGFSALKSLTGLWKIFRNASYLILVIILIGIGFLIMFRIKLNPQTVISLENSLPRIVVTLLLITFSFPIAGFLIDLMYIVMALGVMLFSGYIDVGSEIQFLSGNGWTLWDKIFLNGDVWQVGPALFEILPASTGNVIKVSLTIIVFFLITRFEVVKKAAEAEAATGVGGITGGIISGVLGSIVGKVFLGLIFIWAPFLLSVVVILTALFVFFRIFFLLFKSYIKILLLVIFSPFILLLVAIPGQKMFSIWIKQMLSNLIAFPIVSTLIILSTVISGLDNEGKLWTPPFLYSNQNRPILLLVSIGILFIIPDVVKVVRGALGIKEGTLSTGAGLFFGGASAAAGTAMAPLSKYGSLAFGIGQIRESGWGQRIFGPSNRSTPKHPPPGS